jgi:hypothetical protein
MNHRKKSKNIGLVVAVATSLALTTTAHAKVARVELSKMASSADLVFVGEVETVHEIAGISVAAVRVVEDLKGGAPPVAYYLAQPTWICDTSEAQVHEKALFFLDKSDVRPEVQTSSGDFKRLPRRFAKDLRRLTGSDKFFVLAHSGRGRMPIFERNGQDFAALWPMDVLLREDLSLVEGPESEYSFIKAVRLDELKQTVRTILQRIDR